MIPILFESTETAFVNNGLGRLVDAVSCVVIEERNGEYELEMEYPIDGLHYSDIQEQRIILAEPFQLGTWQPFIIYRISKPINGIVTVNAEHISYLLNKIVVMPFTAASVADVMRKIPQYTANTCPFTFGTDKVAEGNFECEEPKAIRGMLGGEKGSVLSTYGTGEYEFNRFSVFLHLHRGQDNGVTLRYGKNITDLVAELDTSSVYTGIVPYWKGSDGSVVTLTEKVVYSEYRDTFAYDIIKPVDFSQTWQDAPTQAQLRTRAQQYVANNEGWQIANNIKVSFAQLWQSEEYKDLNIIEQVHLCDTVTVIYEALGVQASAKVVRTEYNVLTEKYDAIEIGTAKNSLAKVITSDVEDEINEASQRSATLIEHQTQLITGALGGNVIINRDEDGKPYEILIVNADTIGQATKILRMNYAGIGFGTSYNNITTAWTLDGAFTASFIDTWELSANIIKTGILQDHNGNTTFNLGTGELNITKGKINLGNGTFTVNNSGNVYIRNGEIYQEKYVNTTYGTAWLRIKSTEISGGYTAFGNTAELDLQNTVNLNGRKAAAAALVNNNGDVYLSASRNVYLGGSNLYVGNYGINTVHQGVSGTWTKSRDDGSIAHIVFEKGICTYFD